MKDTPKEVEILDEDLDLTTRITAKVMSLNTSGWERTPGLGYYLGDGIYIEQNTND